MGWRRTLGSYLGNDQPSVQVKQLELSTDSNHPYYSSYDSSQTAQLTRQSSKDSLCKALDDGLVISTRDVDPEHVRSNNTLPAPVAAAINSSLVLPTFSPSEVAKHTSEDNGGVWIVIKEKVFDVTDFMKLEHPGGIDVIDAFAGKQCDWQFDYFHHPRHLKQYEEQLLIGFVQPIPQNPFPRPPKELKADWRVE